jgi:large subunit ribosomal protein L22
MKAFLKNYRQSPRKVRLVASHLRGKSVARGLAELEILPKRAAFPLKKLLNSAVASAKEQGISVENLYIKEVRVDQGVTLKRQMPAAMGTAHRINKRSSHINLRLEEKVAPVSKTAKSKSKVAK